MKATISACQIRKAVSASHHDPFGVLGMHEVEAGGKKSLVVRSFQPDAWKLHVVPEKSPKKRVEMEKIHKAGFFEAVFKGVQDFFPYRLELVEKNGNTDTFYDPYSLPPVLTDYDLHLFAEGNNHKIYDKLGAHQMVLKGIEGFLFAVWAPNALRVSVVGDFNCWDGRKHPMRARGNSGIWELLIPEFKVEGLYKYELKGADGSIIIKADPYSFFNELRPRTASKTYNIEKYSWNDALWLEQRDQTDQLQKPISIYEIHLGSWMKSPEDNRSLTYREIAPQLIAYVQEMGYTHIEFMPLAAHPYDPSWGYQVTGYFSPTARFGKPEDLMFLIDQCHQHNIGVILDWVPAHFPSDGHALASFDGTCLYEHADPKKGMHPDWGTLVFNYGRNEVRNFLTSNALFWIEKYHVDGLRVDAVASMLYLDYSRKDGEWIPNEFGGRENLAAIEFLKRLNEIVYSYCPGVLMIAEESTAWPAVSRPTYLGGLGFALKWNMGWMHDILEYMSQDPVCRKYHHNLLTFALLYAFHENFILAFSHDEVVHGKESLIGKMPGDEWQKFANLRLLLGYMFAHPGKKHLFMGNDIGQWYEWNHTKSIDWHLLQYDPHRKFQSFIKALNHLYCSEPAMFETDFDPAGFEWIDFSDSDSSIVSFIRRGQNPEDILVFVFNFTPVPRYNYRIGVPFDSFYKEVLNSDSENYWGSNLGNFGGVQSDSIKWHGRKHSINLIIPPLGSLVFKPER